jgi:hypothetical protein
MSTHEVLQAAADLVSAFARNDRAAYFGAFTADASFVFYTLPQPLPTKTRPVAGLSRTFVRYAGRAAAPLANVIGADHE